MFLKLTSTAIAIALTTAPTTVAPQAAADPAAETGEAAPTPEPPREDPAMAEAKREYAEGSAAYQTGRYEEAVQHFERSFELSHRSDLLFNLGQAYARWFEVSDRPEHLRTARRLFKNYSATVDESTKARKDALRRIDEIDRQLEELEKADPEIAQPASPADKPLYKKGWFWGTIVGVVVVAAAATTVGVLVARSRKNEFEPELGTIGEFAPGPAAGGGFSLRF